MERYNSLDTRWYSICIALVDLSRARFGITLSLYFVIVVIYFSFIWGIHILLGEGSKQHKKHIEFDTKYKAL